MRLSVLSALARMNVDPWEQAARLAEMPKATAETTLISTLDLLSGRSWKPSDAEAVAARLVRLLPQQGKGATSAAAKIAGVPAQRTNHWLMWLAFAMAVSFLSPHHQAATNADQSKTISSTTSPAQGDRAKSTLPAVNIQSH